MRTTGRWVVIAVTASALMVGCTTSADKGAAAKKASTPQFKPTDVILLKDGSRLVGEIQQLTGGKLVLKTDYAAVVNLDMKKVERIAADRMLNIRIKDGDQMVVGSLRHGAETGQEIQTRYLGSKALALEDIDAIWALGQDDPKEVAQRKALEAQRPKWAFTTSFGVTGQTGNSERISSMLRSDLARTTPDDRSLLYFQARYSRENGTDSEKEFLGGGRQEVDITDRTYGWGRAEFENDVFEDISLRSTATAGFGRFLIREEGVETLAFRAGGGFLHESYKSGGSEGRIIGELAVDYMKRISDRLKYTHSTTYTPSLQELRDYRIKMENALELPLNKQENWKIRMGIKNEYTAVPSPVADRRLDTTYFANLVLEF